MFADGERKFRDGGAAEEVFLNDALQDGGRATVIPHAVRVDHGHGALSTDTEAVGFGAQDVRDAELFEAGF